MCIRDREGIEGEEEDEREEKPPHCPAHCLEHKGPEDNTEHKGKQRRRNLPTLKEYIFAMDEEVKRGDKTEKREDHLIPGKLFS